MTISKLNIKQEQVQKPEFHTNPIVPRNGNRTVRERILREFVQTNEKATGPQLEKELNNGASFFLLGYDLALQIKAINIFVSASSGSRFLTEFLEVGGVLTILEVLTIPQANEIDRTEALRLLLSICSNGRKYKEFICESVRQVTECLSKSRSEATQDYARQLLGNPKFQTQVFKGLQSLLNSQAISPNAQQVSAQGLRMLLLQSQNITVNASLIDPVAHLLRSPHLQVQYEGFELIQELTKRPALQDPIITHLISIMRNIVEDNSEEQAEERHRRNAAPLDPRITHWGMSLEDQKQKELVMAGYVQQAYAAKLIGIMAVTDDEIAERMIKHQVVSALLNVVANVGHPDSQRYAANTLQYLFSRFSYVSQALKTNMGQNFVDLVDSKPDTYFLELTKEQCRYLRRNNIRVRNAEDEGDDEDESSEDLVEQSKPEPIPQQLLEEEQEKAQKKAIMESYEKAVENPMEEEQVQESSAYVQEHSDTGKQKIDQELDKFRNSAKSKGQDTKKEFAMLISGPLSDKVSKIREDPKLFTLELDIQPRKARSGRVKSAKKEEEQKTEAVANQEEQTVEIQSPIEQKSQSVPESKEELDKEELESLEDKTSEGEDEKIVEEDEDKLIEEDNVLEETLEPPTDDAPLESAPNEESTE
ncbi:armadillo-type protein [Gorgonomyces haynaldii]|nr:armadillo-type protein [Gorgonomyces haynaldii]